MTKIYESREDLERERLERKLHHAEKAQKTGAAVAALSWGAFEFGTALEGKPLFVMACSLAGIGALAGGYALVNYVEANKLKDKLATLAPEKVIITPAAQAPAPAPQVSAIAYDGKLQNNLAATVAY